MIEFNKKYDYIYECTLSSKTFTGYKMEHLWLAHFKLKEWQQYTSRKHAREEEIEIIEIATLWTDLPCYETNRWIREGHDCALLTREKLNLANIIIQT